MAAATDLSFTLYGYTAVLSNDLLTAWYLIMVKQVVVPALATSCHDGFGCRHPGTTHLSKPTTLSGSAGVPS